MIKIIIKEVGIAILVLVAIALVLGILLYDYIPNNKTVPIKIEAYKMPKDVEEELKEAVPEEKNIVRTYYIDSTDLDSYEITNDYDKGKVNPFEEYQTDINTNSIVNNNTNNNNSNNNNDNTGVQNNRNENEVYINTPGKNY